MPVARERAAEESACESRTPHGAGADLIDHPPGAHDDLANVTAGVLLLAGQHVGGVLGLVELVKQMSDGKHAELLSDKPPQPHEPRPAAVRTRACSCGGEMREYMPNNYRCASCGHVDTVSSVVQTPPSRQQYAQAQDERSSVLGRGSFGRFGR